VQTETTGADAVQEAGSEVDHQKRIHDLKSHLIEYLSLKSPEDAEKITFVRAADLSGDFGEQFRFFNDERLNETFVAVVPDELWHKGGQPSESSADRGMILFRGGYYDGEGDGIPDPSAWMTHELAHCQRSIDVGDNEYNQESETQFFDDLGPDTYPNNQVEEQAFGRQFAYLKDKKVEREEVTELLEEHYGPDDFKFLNRILDRVYGS